MLDPIILNLETSEFLDTYNDSEFWQVSAKRKLTEMLISTCKDAQDYKKSRQNNKDKISTAHNAICISGSRGAGKTVFLRNAETIWKQAKISNLNVSDLFFSETIDPTLLNGHDNFANVIIAQLYNAVENKLSSPSVDTAKKNDFYTSLKKLAESLGKKSDFSDHTGIDRILKYRSGIQVEAFFHNYVENCVDLLGCEAIVVPIDDVDMALSRAVEVLDEVRRLLSCPYIIPIVSGDHELYSHMVSVHFEESATVNNGISKESTESGHKIGKLLAESYLTKVFPNHLRLPLLPIDRLLPHLLIEEKGISDSINFSQYEKILTNVFFYLCNGQERSTEYPKPSSAREVTQLIKALTPLKLQNFPKHDLWNTFKTWAEQKHHGATYTNAESISQLLDYKSTDVLFRFDQLLAFNPILQAKENVSWADKNFLLEQSSAINDLITTGGRNKDLLFNDNSNIIKSVFNPEVRVLRSMPALELYSNRMTLTVETVGEDDTNLLLAIYTHRDYYGKQGNRSYSVFFSRAFEILSTSILSISNNIKIDDWDAQLNQIIERVPFYSVHAMNPTKYLEQEGEEPTLIADVIPEKTIQTYETSILAIQIKKWEDVHKDKLTELSDLSLIPLLHSVFNKVFTQLHILRTEISTTKKYSEEHLTDTARRFEYIVVNAFASFLQEDYVIQANVAIGAQVKTLRDHKSFMSVDRTLYRNLKGIVDDNVNVEDANTKGKNVTLINNISSTLLDIIWDHPIFVILNNSKETMVSPKFKFIPYVAPVTSKPLKLVSLSNLQNKLGFSNAKKILKWANNNKEEASDVYNRAQQELNASSHQLKENSAHERMLNALKKVADKTHVDISKTVTKGTVVKGVALKLEALTDLQKKLGFTSANKIIEWANNNKVEASDVFRKAQQELSSSSYQLKEKSTHERMFNVLKKFTETSDVVISEPSAPTTNSENE